LTKAGQGTLILTGTNTYNGKTSVVNGTLEIMNPSALPSGASLNVGATAGSLLGEAIIPDLPVAGGDAVAVPEPGTIWLLAIGTLAIAAIISRRRALRAEA